DMTLLHRDGITPVEVSICQGAIAFEGDPLIIGTIKDITERKKLERRLLQAEKLRALGEMAGGISHDFNNLLGAILGRTQLLKMKTDSEKVQQGLDLIEKLALDGSETVRRIQEFTKTKPGAPFVKCLVNNIVRECIEIIKPRWRDQAQSRGIPYKVITELSDTSPIEGNPSELKEVIINLIINALDAMPEGGTLKISTKEEKGNLFVSVQDTGCGIPEEVKRQIFDPFFTTKGVKGNGLGLSVAYGIVTRHNGEFFIESRVGEGTDFTIRVPVNRDAIEPQAEKPHTVAIKGGQSILIIDDEEHIRTSLAEMLELSGYKVSSCSSGEEGLSRLKEGKVDLVITDLGMPGMSGWQVVDTIRRDHPGVITILMTGWGYQIDPEDIKSSGVDEIVCKPFKLNDILSIFNSLFSGAARQKSEPPPPKPPQDEAPNETVPS
ncbi:ATP-binding protein, partial [Acidobacteriota bacterium]